MSVGKANIEMSEQGHGQHTDQRGWMAGAEMES
jgi:hypothetical protein